MQERLRDQVIAKDSFEPPRLIGAVDASHRRETGITCAVAALLSFPDLELRTWTSVRRPTDFPYVPGYLSFREAPAILGAVRRLRAVPDVLLVDGQGIAHPRRFGIACHIGVLADVPAIGIAKSRLVGAYDEPGRERGAWSPLLDRGEVIGAVLRTRTGTRPVFVSVGHRVCLETAIELVLHCTPRYRLPEPIRQADRLSRL